MNKRFAWGLILFLLWACGGDSGSNINEFEVESLISSSSSSEILSSSEDFPSKDNLSSSEETALSSENIVYSSKNETSSSSAENSSSSFNVADISVSSESEINFPAVTGCVAFYSNQEPASYGVIDAFVQKRVAVLEMQGLDSASARNVATQELYRELGLDTLLQEHFEITNSLFSEDFLGRVEKLENEGLDAALARDSAFHDFCRKLGVYDKCIELGEFAFLSGHDGITLSELEYTLFYLYKSSETELSQTLIDDFADGTLDSGNYCITDKPYDRLDELPRKFIHMGCAYDPKKIQHPLSIMRNIWRKCIGMPYCSKELYGTIYSSGKNHFKCEDGEWISFFMREEEKNGSLCSENGTYLTVDEKNGKTTSYICYEYSWYDLSQSANLPAQLFLNPDYSYGVMGDSREIQAYRTTRFEGQTWLSEDMDYYEYKDSLITNHSLCAKVVYKPDANFMIYGDCDGASRFYTFEAAKNVCPKGWRLPTRADWNGVMEKAEEQGTSYLKKLFVIGNGTATDEFGLSLRRDGGVKYSNGIPEFFLSGSNLFWLEDGSFVITDAEKTTYSTDKELESTALIPVRCIKN